MSASTPLQTAAPPVLGPVGDFFGGVGDFFGGIYDGVVSGTQDFIGGIFDRIGDLFGSVLGYLVKGAVTRFWNMMTSVIMDHLIGSEKDFLALFMLHPTPFVGTGVPTAPDRSEPTGVFDITAVWTTDRLLWLAGAVAVASIGFTGGRALWYHARGYHQTLKTVLSGMVIMVVATLLVIHAVKILLWLGDQYSVWILFEADTFERTECLSKTYMGVRTYLIVGLFAPWVVIAFGLQILLMSFRGALLMVLAATMVVPAATATTPTGRKWLNKYFCWMLAFIFLKPATATLFAVAGKLYDPKKGCDGMSPEESLGGLLLMAAGAFVLPALLRVLTPSSVVLAEPFAAPAGWIGNYAVREVSNSFAWTGSANRAPVTGSRGSARTQRAGYRANQVVVRNVRRVAGIGVGVAPSVVGLGLNNVHAYQDYTNELKRELSSSGEDGPLSTDRTYESDWS